MKGKQNQLHCISARSGASHTEATHSIDTWVFYVMLMKYSATSARSPKDQWASRQEKSYQGPVFTKNIGYNSSIV